MKRQRTGEEVTATPQAAGCEMVRLIWTDFSGLRRCRVVPQKRLEEVKISGVGLARGCLFMPSFADAPPADPAARPVGEVRLIPDMATLRSVPWRARESMAIVNMRSEETGEAWECCPRAILASALELLKREAGVTLMAGFETEFILLNKPDKLEDWPTPIDSSLYAQTSAYDAVSPIMQEMCAALEDLGQEVEQVHAESAPGQFEIVTAFGPATDAADALIYRKEAICGVAQKHGLVACFLPKPFPSEAGNGCHVHFSLADSEGKNAMADPQRQHSLSVLGEAFAAGLLRHMPALMPFTAASPNSYERIQPQTWSGAFNCWGVNNREAPLRLVGLQGRPETVNFELKTVDSTANPYLALAAIIAAGVAGIRSSTSELPAPVQEDPATLGPAEKEAAGVARLPTSLNQALDALQEDKEFRSVLQEAVGGSSTVARVYRATKLAECEHYGTARDRTGSGILELYGKF